MDAVSALSVTCAAFGVTVRVSAAADTLLLEPCSVQANGEQALAALLEALAVADALGLATVTLTLAARRVTIDLTDVADYFDGVIDRATLLARWGDDADGDLHRRPGP